MNNISPPEGATHRNTHNELYYKVSPDPKNKDEAALVTDSVIDYECWLTSAWTNGDILEDLKDNDPYFIEL